MRCPGSHAVGVFVLLLTTVSVWADARRYEKEEAPVRLDAQGEVTVAILDSGMDFLHPVLNSLARRDGYNFGDCGAERLEQSLPCAHGRPQDRLGHGTRVARLLIDDSYAEFFRQGWGRRLRLLPFKVNPGLMDDFEPDTVAAALRAATAAGASVINLSLSMPNLAPAQRGLVGAALQQALDAGVAVVVAAGNKPGELEFPATWPGVIAVAALEPSGRLWRGSSWAPAVSIAAPGWIADSASGPHVLGTSFAAPRVAAAIAKLLMMEPGLSSAAALAVLRNTARPIPNQPSLGFGALDAERALQQVRALGWPRDADAPASPEVLH